MVTRQSEGDILRNRFRESGKKLKEIADILGMTKKKVKRHLRRSVLKRKFRILVDQKEILIFKTGIIEMAEEMVDSIIKNIIYLKAADKVSNMLLCEIAAKTKETSYSTEALQLEKNIDEEVARLSDKFLKS
jgi:predicted transcriptional regulator